MVVFMRISFSSPKLVSSMFFITILSCILLTAPTVTPLSFNLSTINPGDQNTQIITESNCYISDEGIEVTTNSIGSNQIQRAGRATYAQPLHLWDNASGQLVDFNTSFTFVIDSQGKTAYGDGITFFLAQNNSNITAGGAIGLPVTYPVHAFVNISTIVAYDQFVAVEFDTFWDSGWDPVDSNNNSIGDHVGIDISSIQSVKAEKWLSNVTYGAQNEAWISYDSNSKNLSVVFTGFQGNTMAKQLFGLEYTVDLRNELPEWVIFGFTGATGARFEINNIKSWSFQSSELEGQQSVSPAPNDGQTASPATVKGQSKTGLAVGLGIGSCVVLVGLGLICFVLVKKKRKEKVEEAAFDMGMDSEFEMGSGPKRFTYNELSQASNNFSEDDKLGEGGFGAVYKGFLRELNSYVAVKRVSKSSKQGIKEYASEVRIISRLRHRNLVQLLGWCHEKKELLLVYEFMENGSLDSHLFKETSSLTWGSRYKIAQGLASALLYLHEEWEQCVLHRDIKSSNVMLDSNFNAKLGDFGLAKLVDHEKGSQTTVLAGTMGYMAPESCITGRASKESDVFSFGVVALEIACGRKPIDFKAQENRINLVAWVWELYGTGKLLWAVDPKLGGDFDEKEVNCLMLVGLWCAHPDLHLRPSIKQAIQVMTFEAPLPILPSKMPVATYLAPPTSSIYGISTSESSQTQSSITNYNTDYSNLSTSSPASSPSTSLLYSKKANLEIL